MVDGSRVRHVPSSLTDCKNELQRRTMTMFVFVGVDCYVACEVDRKLRLLWLAAQNAAHCNRVAI